MLVLFPISARETRGASGRFRSLVCVTLMHMTVRITVSLPDDMHADLLRVAGSSNISASAVVRALLSEVLPKMTGILDYLGTVTPAQAAPLADEIDAWSASLRTLLHDAPRALDGFRTALDEGTEGDEKP